MEVHTNLGSLVILVGSLTSAGVSVAVIICVVIALGALVILGIIYIIYCRRRKDPCWWRQGHRRTRRRGNARNNPLYQGSASEFPIFEEQYGADSLDSVGLPPPPYSEASRNATYAIAGHGAMGHIPGGGGNVQVDPPRQRTSTLTVSLTTYDTDPPPPYQIAIVATPPTYTAHTNPGAMPPGYSALPDSRQRRKKNGRSTGDDALTVEEGQQPEQASDMPAAAVTTEFFLSPSTLENPTYRQPGSDPQSHEHREPSRSTLLADNAPTRTSEAAAMGNMLPAAAADAPPGTDLHKNPAPSATRPKSSPPREPIYDYPPAPRQYYSTDQSHASPDTSGSAPRQRPKQGSTSLEPPAIPPRRFAPGASSAGALDAGPNVETNLGGPKRSRSRTSLTGLSPEVSFSAGLTTDSETTNIETAPRVANVDAAPKKKRKKGRKKRAKTVKGKTESAAVPSSQAEDADEGGFAAIAGTSTTGLPAAAATTETAYALRPTEEDTSHHQLHDNYESVV